MKPVRDGRPPCPEALPPVEIVKAHSIGNGAEGDRVW